MLFLDIVIKHGEKAYSDRDMREKKHAKELKWSVMERQEKIT
jgi:hypothetical protein